jgi:hypothetical protein
MRYFLVLMVIICLAGTTNAQVSLGLSFNLNSQPAWGPTGNDYAEYYYLPDIETYYNVSQHRFYYNLNGRWIYSSNLPRRYRDYDLYNSYKVVVNERNPWRNHSTYRDKYSSFKDRHDQQPIRDSRDSKYFANRNHPEHNNWVRQQRRDDDNRNRSNNGNNGNGKGNGNKREDRQGNGKGKK